MVTDPLGFTRQTEMVLRGVRAQDLIKTFKNRNISTDQLHRLTKEDLVILGKRSKLIWCLMLTRCVIHISEEGFRVWTALVSKLYPVILALTRSKPSSDQNYLLLQANDTSSAAERKQTFLKIISVIQMCLVSLGADESQANNIINALCISKKHKSDVKPKSYQRITEIIDQILEQEETHLQVIRDYLKYCRLRLRKERINCFVEPDEALSASKILCITADTTLKEVTEAELKLKELEAVIIKPQRRRNSLVLYCISISSLCIGMCILSKFWKRF